MSAGAGAVRAGGAYVEIFAKDGAFQQAMTRVQNKLKAVSAAMRQIGGNMTIGGAAMAAPILAAVNGARRFEDALLDAKASAGLTANEIDRVRQKALELSKAGVGGPGEIAEAFTALVKAGMPLEKALDGAAEAVVKFASNAGLDTTRAAEIASDAMNVFGESTTSATDILKAAADSSSTNIDQMTQAFSQSSAVAGQAGQSMATLSAALAIMASQGVKGSDAGTSVKTMIQRLTTGADTAAEALAEIGLGVASFRDAGGNVLPLAQIMDILNAKLGTLDKASRDNVMARIFGTDAIRAAQILTTAGSEGFAAMTDQMQKSMTNAQAFEERMSGITGAIRRLNAALERMSVAVSGGLGDVIASVEKGLTTFFNIVSGLAEKFPVLSQSVAGAAGFLLAFGLATKVAGFAMSGLVQTFSLVKALPALLNPVTLGVVGVGAAVAGALVIARELSPTFKRETDAIASAFMAGNISGAIELIGANAGIAALSMRHAFEDAIDAIRNAFASVGAFIGDKLTEGLDRFMGLFGADILTLQDGFLKLGAVFRSAFDWDFARKGLDDTLQRIDAETAAARGRSPTAATRAADRLTEREQAAGGRGGAAGDREARQRAEMAAATANRDAVRDGITAAKEMATSGDAVETATRNFRQAFREAGAFTPAAAEATGKGGAAASTLAGGGRSVGTFGSGEGLGIGPELNTLEDSSRETAVNTAQMVQQLANRAELEDQIAALRAKAAGGALDAMPNPDALDPARRTAPGEMPDTTAIEAQIAALQQQLATGAVATNPGGGATGAIAAAPAVGALGDVVAAGGPMAGGAVVAGAAPPAIDRQAPAVQAGMAHVTEIQKLAQIATDGFKAVVAGIAATTAAVKTNGDILKKIADNTARAGETFA